MTFPVYPVPYLRAMRLLLGLSLLFHTVLCPAQSGYDVLRKAHVHRQSNLDPIFKGVSASVLPATLGAPLAVFAIGVREKDPAIKRKAYVMGASILVSGGISLALKLTVHRPRPYATHPDIQPLVHSGPYSFPSAHTSNAFATATSLTLAYPRWYVAAPSFAWASMAGYSRMHLGVHYPGDVVAGALIGSGSALACFYLNRWLLSE